MSGAPPPPDWMMNGLTTAFENIRGNQFATFHNKPAARDLVAIDRCLRKLVADNVDPDPEFPMQFLLRAHSCYQAAAACAMGGQVYESTVLQRATLEAAAYGLYIGSDVERGALWMSRGDSRTSKQRARDEFAIGNLRRYFTEHHSDVSQAFALLYEVLIDFGAHPNELGFSISMDLRKEGRQKHVDTVYAHVDGLALDFGLKNVARTGLSVILAFKELYPNLYETKSVAGEVDELVARH